MKIAKKMMKRSLVVLLAFVMALSAPMLIYAEGDSVSEKEQEIVKEEIIDTVAEIEDDSEPAVKEEPAAVEETPEEAPDIKAEEEFPEEVTEPEMKEEFPEEVTEPEMKEELPEEVTEPEAEEESPEEVTEEIKEELPEEEEYTVSEVRFTEDGMLILPRPVKEGKVFIEWNTEEDGSGTGYKAGEIVDPTDIVLYSIWADEVETVNDVEAEVPEVKTEEITEEKEEAVTPEEAKEAVAESEAKED